MRLLLGAHYEGAKKTAPAVPSEAGVHKVGNLPLHHAVVKRASEAVVKALLNAHPEGAKEKGDVRGPFFLTLLTLAPRD